jgi:hypothetical protein
VALVVGIEGLDKDQLQLGSSEKFWTLIEERRRQKTISRREMKKTLDDTNERLRKLATRRRAQI